MYTYALFPNLLDLAPLAVTLLRLAAATVFLAQCLRLARAAFDAPHDLHLRTRALGWLYALVPGVIGVLLLAGLYTQGAALAGAILAAQTYTTLRRDRAPASARHLQALLATVCVALVFLGAGIFSIDLPL